jgi:hypothetical protein
MKKNSGRIVAVTHRVKLKADGAESPTKVTIFDGKKRIQIKLKDQLDEIDFLNEKFPVEFRAPEDDEDVSGMVFRHLKSKLLKKRDLESGKINENHVVIVKKSSYLVKKVPTAYEGLRKGDTVLMILGGSGDGLASAISRLGKQIGYELYRVPPVVMKNLSDANPKIDEQTLLLKLWQEKPDEFHEMLPRDLNIIMVRELLRARTFTMKDRIACGQRIRSQLISMLLRELNLDLEGSLEQQFDERKANSSRYQSLVIEEKALVKELLAACEKLDVYNEIFEPVTGVGPLIGARIIGSIIDIQRFIVVPDEKKMNELAQEISILEAQGKFEEYLENVTDRLTPGDSHYRRVQLVRTWLRKNGNIQESKLLDRSLKLHGERHKLRQQAMRIGIGKLKKFSGASPNADGTFPRSMKGQQTRWNRDIRQALFLCGDQFSRRPGSEWGQKLIANKVKEREKHPVIVCKTCSMKLYAEYSTTRKKVDLTYDEWTKLPQNNIEDYEIWVTHKGNMGYTEDEYLDMLKNKYEEFIENAKEYKRENEVPLEITYPEWAAITEAEVPWSDKHQKSGHKRSFNDLHIHKRAIWLTVAEFVEYVYREWYKLVQRSNNAAKKELKEAI